MIVGLYNLRTSYRQVRFAGLEQAKALLSKEDEIKDNITSFLANYRKLPSPDSLLEKHGTGSKIYYSDELKEFRKICNHYDTVGALMNGRYLDFDLYYQIVSFPDDFYVETRELREKIKNNWYSKDIKDRVLKDFLSNLESLRKRYETQREKDLGRK
jgi:hypothetical protein